MAELVKTVQGLPIASTKTLQGLARASAKTIMGLDNTSAAVAMDMYISGDGPTGEITTTDMAACTFSTDGGAWTLPDNAGATDITFDSGANLGALRNPVLVNGNTYDGVITNGIRLIPSVLATDRALRSITARPQVLIGYLFRANIVGGADFSSLDFMNLEAANGSNFSVSQWRNNSPAFMRAHSQTAPGTVNLSTGTGVDNQIYWVQTFYDNVNDRAETGVWSVSGSTYTPVDAQGLAMTTTQDCSRIFLGLTTHGVLSSSIFDWCNLVAKWNSPGPVDTLMI